MKALNTLLIAFALVVAIDTASAQSSRPYKDGPVIMVTSVRTKPGAFDDYMRYLGGAYKAQMEATQKAGITLGYKIFAVTPRTPQDPDVILVVTYPNMAALDKTEEMDQVSTSVAGSIASQNKGFADRGSLRDFLGTQLMREVVLK